MSSLPLVFFVLQFFKIFFSSFLSPQCGNYKSKAFFFNVKCIYLKKYKINYKPVFAYGLSLSFYQSGSVPFLAALAVQERRRLPRGSRHGGKDTLPEKLSGETRGSVPGLPRPGLHSPETVSIRAPCTGLWEASGPCPHGHLSARL